MAERLRLSRRRFLQAGAAAAGGLVIGFYLPAASERKDSDTDEFTPNAWIRLAPDGEVTAMVASSEMGQGVMTAIPMLLAEELDADWNRVRAEFAPVGDAYVNPAMGRQATGGSTAVRGFWRPVREAGAAAREMLIAAAADGWGVPGEECATEPHAVVHRPSGRRVGYGELADSAARQAIPEMVFLKEPDEFRIIGRPTPRLDTPAKTDGSAVFGQDIVRPGMLTAVIARCPVFGGKLESFDAAGAEKVAGVRRVIGMENGVAVLADGFWPAQKGRDRLKITWDEGENASLDSATIRRRFREAVTAGDVARHEGEPRSRLEDAAQKLEAEYEVPYLAHACMEPMNCTAEVRSDRCDVWVPTQAQGATRSTAARITGLAPEAVHVHTTFLGGGFGRRSEQDFVAEAVTLSKESGRPVKVLWTREDDTRHDYYRPATFNTLAAGLDEAGRPTAWVHRIAGPSIMHRVATGSVADGIDRTSVEGAANLPYAIPGVEVTYAMVNPGVPVGFWRSVGSSQNAFVTECFVDELAAAAGADPYRFRRGLLNEHSRHRQVLDLAAEKAGWGGDPGKGRGRGMALAESSGRFGAEVGEVSVEGDRVRVDRVVCAVDCGAVVNPATVEAQMASGIVYGLSAALEGEITLRDGRVVQGNFDDYPILRIGEMPEVEVHVIDSREPPGGVGEPGTPPIAPAVANAVHDAVGIRVRRLPIRLGGSHEGNAVA